MKANNPRQLRCRAPSARVCVTKSGGSYAGLGFYPCRRHMAELVVTISPWPADTSTSQRSYPLSRHSSRPCSSQSLSMRRSPTLPKTSRALISHPPFDGFCTCHLPRPSCHIRHLQLAISSCLTPISSAPSCSKATWQCSSPESVGFAPER